MTIARVVAVAVLCLSSRGFALGQTPSETASVEKHITQTLHQMYEAEKRRDLKFVLSRLSDDFEEVAGDGLVYRRADIEANWDGIVLNDYTLSDCLFRLMTRDVAYMSCRMEVDAAYKGQPLPKHFRVTTVWQRRNGQWLIRFEQGTIVPAPRGS